MSALLGELRGLDKAGSSLASRHRESGASPDTRPVREPAHQHFCRPWSRPAPGRGLGLPTPGNLADQAFFAPWGRDIACSAGVCAP